MSFERTTLKIPSATQGWALDAWQYVPASTSTKPLPVIVMAHGSSHRRDMHALCFDYRRWGVSDGAPRKTIIVKEQLEDYRTVIKYARQQPQFDAQRVVVWGSSFSGGHAVTLSADPSVNAVAALAQCPYTGVFPPLPLGVTLLKTVFYVLSDVLKQALGFSPTYIPAVAEPGEVGGLTAEGTVPAMMAIVSAESDYTNQVAASSLIQVALYHPRKEATRVACPLLIVLPTEDNLCLPSGAREISAAAPNDHCELVEVPCGHFDLYHGASHHEKSIATQLAFLAKHVPL
ncbi:Hydrolase-4 domain-containing protein [Mycena chlorophos]|uniref:Hydrolase-4 domain-containing protein n=1 Tax=Mycena chlorophos TaxID=658473 RepID=A0A8H6TEB6_MYCCL|nr:Hydrolase-4 domain-containing protein [Mycena chlorophos]